MGLLAPRWAVLGDLGVMLRHVGGKMATKSAKMSQHRRQEANPRGFEGSAGLPDGRDTLSLAPWGAGREGHPGSRANEAPGLGGGSRGPVSLFSCSRL